MADKQEAYDFDRYRNLEIIMDVLESLSSDEDEIFFCAQNYSENKILVGPINEFEELFTMLRKAFQVQVEIEVHAVSCPGVWLCPNGKVSLQLYMLGSCIQTSSAEPIFPLVYQEKFIFYKTFFSVQKLNGLQKLLSKESLYAELVQWQNCEVGNVLAIFKTSLTELLFPGSRGGTMAGVDIDLLMEPMKNFPGILAPKIEVSTKTTIEDKICPSDDVCESYVVNPHVVPSKNSENLQPHLRQKRVCHSSNYHRSRKCTGPCQDLKGRPLFAYRRVDEDLINRKPQDMEITGYCNCRKSPERNLPKVERCGRSKSTGRSHKSVVCVKKEKRCDCDDDAHSLDNCPVCSKYNYYFEGKVPSIRSKKSPAGESHAVDCPCVTDNRNKLCNYPPIGNKKRSLASKIHERLTDTLNQCPTSPVFENCSSEMPMCRSDCCSMMEDNCTVSSIGQFYKDFYRKSRAKCEKYISCN